MKMFASLLLFAVSLQSQAALLDPSKGKTEFLAVGRPAALRINGTGEGPSGNFTLKRLTQDFILSGEATVNLETFDTGIGMRDRHMKETYLETGKFKTATLTFRDIKISAEKIDHGGTLTVPATLELHGKQAAVDAEITLVTTGGEISATTTFKVNLATYGVEIPKYAGITVANEVTVTTQTRVPKTSLSESL